jgi:hypothetical protein
MDEQLTRHYSFAFSELLTEGKNIFITMLDGTTMYTDKSQQIVIKKAIKSYCRKIDYSPS